MFVKIIRKADGVWYNDTYECENASVWEAKEDTEIVNIRLDGQMLLSFEKKDTLSIFYLNNEGRTVDKVL